MSSSHFVLGSSPKTLTNCFRPSSWVWNSTKEMFFSRLRSFQIPSIILYKITSQIQLSSDVKLYRQLESQSGSAYLAVKARPEFQVEPGLECAFEDRWISLLMRFNCSSVLCWISKAHMNLKLLCLHLNLKLNLKLGLIFGFRACGGQPLRKWLPHDSLFQSGGPKKFRPGMPSMHWCLSSSAMLSYEFCKSIAFALHKCVMWQSVTLQTSWPGTFKPQITCTSNLVTCWLTSIGYNCYS